MNPMRILVTAGPTREFIDPVRFISNSSTGNMGYALAKAAREKGHKVTLVSGPVNLKPPKNIKKVEVINASGMFNAVKNEFKKADCLIMAAAVCDFKPQATYRHKIKKKNPGRGKAGKTLKRKLFLTQNPDILLWAGENKQKRLIAGFCMETQALIKGARQKLKAKNADIIVANKIDRHNLAFGDGPARVLILDKAGGVEKIGPANKEKIAKALIDKVEQLWHDGMRSNRERKRCFDS